MRLLKSKKSKTNSSFCFFFPEAFIRFSCSLGKETTVRQANSSVVKRLTHFDSLLCKDKPAHSRCEFCNSSVQQINQKETVMSNPVYIETSQATVLLREFMAKVENKNKLDERKAFVHSVGFGR